MAKTIVHRGPDSGGHVVGDGFALGARRLRIIDLEHGDQPISNEDETITIVFNGEVYNHASLRRMLERLGHVFRTATDTEVVVHAYEEWGEECLLRFRGMYAFAIWDERAETLFMSVDRFGIKPLYFSATDEGIVFGSEPTAIFASRRVERSLDEDALITYLALGYVPAPDSIYQGVQKLRPGTFLRWRRAEAGVAIRTYWDAPTEATAVAGDEARAEVRALLDDAVRSHLVSDVPVGLFLSGGIDSSLLLALMARYATKPVQTFTIGFGARGFDELEPARELAAHFGAEHHELLVDADAAHLLPQIVRHFQEPFADSAALPVFAVAALARDHVKVVLSGDGGDEMFVGYTTFLGVEAARLAQQLPGWTRRALAAPRPLPRRPPRLANAASRWDRRLRLTAAPPMDAYCSKVGIIVGEEPLRLLTPDLRDRYMASDPVAPLTDAFASDPRSPLAGALAASRNVGLPGDMLVKVDRMSMAHSLEVRVPLLDHRLADLVLRLPHSELFARRQLKSLLRDSVRDLLPESVFRRPKHGFDVPLASWFRGTLGEFAADVLLDRGAEARGIVDAAGVERALADVRAGSSQLVHPLWALLMLELWFHECL